MKSLIINYLSILLCAQAFFACAPDVKKVPERTFRIIHNNDGSDLLGTAGSSIVRLHLPTWTPASIWWRTHRLRPI